MGKIIEIISVLALFIFFFYFLYRLNLKTIKKEDKKEDKKAEENKSSVESGKKEDIPEILKEVTMGNYMYDISKDIKIELNPKDQESVDMKESEFDIDKAFETIDNQDLEDIEIEEIEDDLMDEIDFEIDGVLVNDDTKIITQKKKNLAEEYSNLSGNMKALIIANFLDKKNYDN